MSGRASYIDEDGTYWVLDRAQIECLASPRRHDIVDRLVPSGPLSVKELAAMVGAEPPALYHHLRKLVEVGLVVEAGHRVVRRKREQLYNAPAKRVRLAKAQDDPANRETFISITAATCRQMDRDYRRGAHSGAAVTHGPGKNLGFSRLIGAPDAKGMAKINRCLEEIAEVLWASPGKGGDLVAVSWVVAPIAAANGDDEEG